MADAGSPDLFAAAAQERLGERAPLAARMRPRDLDEVVGQAHLLGPGRPLRVLVGADRLGSVILWGPPGTGKTTLARLVAGATRQAFEQLSAVTAGVRDVREVVDRARRRLGERGQGTILFLDEVHRFNRTQQDALLPHVEDGLLTFVGATTENPYFSLTGPLLSRATLHRLEPLSEHELRTLAGRALADAERGLGAEPVSVDEEALDHLADRSEGDARHLLTSLELAHALVVESGRDVLSLADAESALALRSVRYGDDDHYDVVSAFIKSIRGSDPDAGLYWLARMLEAGEDPRFVARRLVILASEDVGLADPLSLLVADAAARAVELVGLPEARLNLAQAVVHLAIAPKSASVTRGLAAATGLARDRRAGAVPLHLRDAHSTGGRALGHGRGYRYPHDAPEGWVPQEHLPPEVAGERCYVPDVHGAEPELARWWQDRAGAEADGGPSAGAAANGGPAR